MNMKTFLNYITIRIKWCIMNRYEINEEIILIDALEKMDYTHKKAKSLLTNKQVLVNNRVVTKYNHSLKKNDVVEVRSFSSEGISNNIKIVYEDKDIIVVEKPHNLLTIATSKEKDKTLYHLVSNYLKFKNKNAKVFVVHRLDKETSGLVLFAKNEKIKTLYQNKWNDIVKYRGYVAVVEGILEKKKDTIKLNLKEENNLKVYVSKDGKEAITCYSVIKENKKYSLLDIEIKTGRKNQIRVSMQHIKHPVLGDIKYSSKDNSLRRLALHAYKLVLINPINKKEMKFEIDMPESFKRIIKKDI